MFILQSNTIAAKFVQKNKGILAICAQKGALWDPWFKFYFPLVWGTVMCNNEFET